MRSTPLLPFLPAGLVVQRVVTADRHVTISARARGAEAACPLCGRCSRRVHGRYPRRVRDLPWQGHRVDLDLQVRRFRCADAGCPRRIFAERMPDVAAPRRQRTSRLAEAQRCVGHAAGGERGARLAARLGMPVSGDTLLRLIRSGSPGPAAAPAARVIGIDDWAWRRGRRYGTIIVGLERNRAIDLLPDREAETVAGWLKAHPGVEIVARDRAGAYADGVRTGAPGAIQVADRWHLLRNLGDTLAGVLGRHHRDLRTAAKAAIDAPTGAPPPAHEPSAPPAVEPPRGDPRAARRARFDEAVASHGEGRPVKQIARMLGLDPKTVRGWLRSGRLPTWSQRPRGSAADRHADHLRRRWGEGCRNAALLWREIEERGFRGRPRTVQRWVAHLRDAAPSPSLQARSAAAWKTPSGRRAAWLAVADADTLDGAERRFVDALVAASPDLARVIGLARRLCAMVRGRQEAALDPWLSAAAGTALAAFADGLERDLGAIRSALSLPWSTGPVEGQISHLKTIKRTMPGRAKFDLLRSRVLQAA